jgi:hypothetical protein
MVLVKTSSGRIVDIIEPTNNSLYFLLGLYYITVFFLLCLGGFYMVKIIDNISF